MQKWAGPTPLVDGSFEARYDVLIEDLARFGTGADSLRLYKIGPPPKLLGQPVDRKQTSRRFSAVAIAIAVNSTIWGTTRTYRVSYRSDFWRVMLPESCLKPAANDLRVFQIVDSPTGPTQD